MHTKERQGRPGCALCLICNLPTSNSVMPEDVHRNAQYGGDLWRQLRPGLGLARDDDSDETVPLLSQH